MAVRSIVSRSVLAALASASFLFSNADAWAAKPVAASAYGVQIQHAERPTAARSQAAVAGKDSKNSKNSKIQSVDVDLTLANRGKRDLYDVYVYLIRANGRTLRTSPEPMRVRLLPAGQSKVLTWTFEPQQSLMGLPPRDLAFRIEAVDPTTQQIVSFEQQSTGVR